MKAVLRYAPVYAAPALEKGLDLLEALAAQPAPRAQADLARTLGRSSSEIFRMLNCLEKRGYIAKEDGTGRYRLTLKLYALAHTHTPVDQILRAAEWPMRDLAQDLRESCHLSVLSEGKLVVLYQAVSPDPRRFSIEVGGRFPVVNTASGRLLLAHLARPALEEFLSRDEEYARLDRGSQEQFLATLLEIRRTGVSTAVSETTLGVKDVAVLVGDPGVGVTAALCVPALGPVGRKRTIPELRTALRRCAKTITRSLGLSVK